MKRNIKAVVIVPDGYANLDSLPVVYLLHGYSGNYASWSASKNIKILCDVFKMIIVCPDGGFSSWYWNSPIDSSYKYETYVGVELPAWIDAHYKTRRDRNARAITGLSMGGHGGLYLAINHKDIFGAGGSMSGGVDIRPFPLNWDMAKRLGAYSTNKDTWDSLTVINQLYKITPGEIAIIIDCGINDFFYDVNEELHKKLLYYNIPHDYITRPGGHTWDYWENAVQFQLMYFNAYFAKKNMIAK